jgi:glycosyltransferase involved in cell wall biosynthesis
LRVGLFATSVAFGGIEQVLLTLLEHMDPGVELVPVVFTRTDIRETSFFDRLAAMGLPCEKLYVNIVRPVYVVNPLRNLAEAIALGRRYRFDLIHSHGYRADMFALAVSRLMGIPVVSTCHGFTATDRRLRFYQQLDIWLLRRLSRVIAVSAGIKEDLVRHGLDAGKVPVIPNAIREVPTADSGERRSAIRARFGIAENEFVFGYVGRLSEEKGAEYLVRAAAKVRKSRAIRLLVLGEGPQRADLEAAAGRAGLADRVIFAGFQRDPGEWYPAMDAFVLPSLTEGTPLALLEAMAHGIPVIASEVGGVPAVVSHERTALLVPPADTAALAGAMEALASNPDLSRTLSGAARRVVEQRYQVKDWIRQTVDVYEQSLTRRGRQVPVRLARS